MTRITIRLRYNLETGKQDIYVDYESERDALPIEHEQDHRRIVEQLIGQGVLNEDEVGQVKVGRVQPTGATARRAEEPGEPQPEPERG